MWTKRGNFHEERKQNILPEKQRNVAAVHVRREKRMDC